MSISKKAAVVLEHFTRDSNMHQDYMYIINLLEKARDNRLSPTEKTKLKQQIVRFINEDEFENKIINELIEALNRPQKGSCTIMGGNRSRRTKITKRKAKSRRRRI